jgi:hypothetical protein
MGVGVFHLHVTDLGACLFIALHCIFNHMTVIFMSNYHDQPVVAVGFPDAAPTLSLP